MDENYLDDLLGGVEDASETNKQFKKNINMDADDLDFDDFDDLSLEELDNLDDVYLDDTDLDDIDFDDVDITSLSARSAAPQSDQREEEDFNLDDLVHGMQRDDEEYVPETSLDAEEQKVATELDNILDGGDDTGASAVDDLDYLLNFSNYAQELGDAGIFEEAEEKVQDDMNLDDLFSALGIDEEEAASANDELDDMFESAAADLDLSEFSDINDVNDAGAEKQEKKKKSFYEIVFGEPDEDDLEEERLLLQKKEEKKAKKEAKNALLEQKKAERKEKSLEKKEKAKIKKAERLERKREELEEELEESKHEKAVSTPVALVVFVIFIAICAVTCLGSKGFHYAEAIRKASDYFERQRYRLAYDEVAGVDVKEDDQELKDRIYTVMYVERLYEAYENNIKLENYDKALDALLRGIIKYDEHYAEAVELDIVKDIDACKLKIVLALGDVYSLTEAEAEDIIRLDGQAYTRALDEACEGVQIGEEQ